MPKVTKHSLSCSIGESLFSEDFFAAAQKGDARTVERILETCPDAVGWKNADGKTALDVARQNNQSAVVQTFKAKG